MDHLEEISEWDEDNIVLTLEGNGTPAFGLKGRINKQPFVTMIDSGLPITIFPGEGVQKLLKTSVTFVRLKKEVYVDYNGRPLNLLGYITVEVQVWKRIIKNAVMIIARDGKKSLLRRDWLAQLNFREAKAKQESEYNKNVNKSVNNVELLPELRILQQKLPNIFSRHGKFVGHTKKFDFKEDAKITQHKGRRVPLQLQQAVDQDIQKSIEGRTHQKNRQNNRRYVHTTSCHNSKEGPKCLLALDGTSLNKAMRNNKYQMPNLENLMDKAPEIDNNNEESEVLFTSLNMQFACGQIVLHQENAKHCKLWKENQPRPMH